MNAPSVNATLGPVETMLRQLHALAGPRAAKALDMMLDELPVHELAALAYDRTAWARPAQLPTDGAWRSFGVVAGRGWGKDWSQVGYLLDEVAAGRAMRCALVGQSEAKCIEILVEGETGILNLCPPWLGCEWQPSSNRVLFGNGAVACVYTAQEPAGLRGPQHHLGLATEVAAWPTATRAEALENLILGLRLGYGRLLWNTTPRRKNPLVRWLLERSKAAPEKHIVRTGATTENEINLSAEVVAEWVEAWGGTQRGAEELEGRFFDDEEGAMFRQAWIDKARRTWPEKLKRRVISIDPAITSDPRFSDATGILDMGLGVDGQIFALRNLTGVLRAEVWPGLVVDAYVTGGCDVLIIETNRGGAAWAALLRGAAVARGLSLVELGPDEHPGRRPGVVYMRAYNSRGAKAVRASAAAALVERGRVSCVEGQLGDLEARLTSFDGAEGAIDDCVDAFVAGCIELAGLGADQKNPDRSGEMQALLKMSEQMKAGAPPPRNVLRPIEPAMVRGSGWGDSATGGGGFNPYSPVRGGSGGNGI